MKPIRTALIGCGSVSQRGILPHLSLDDAREWIDLVAVCDVAEDRARQTAEQFDVRSWYSDPETLFAEADIEVVLIATPAPFHFPLAMAAVENGLHIHVQKPMTTTVAEADELLEAVRRKGVKLVASPGQMIGAGAQQIKQLIEEGAIGRVYWAMATTAFRGHEHEPFRADNPVDPTWYYKAGGGPVYDMATYTLHTLTGILGPAQRVTAMSGIGLPTREILGREIRVEMDDNTLLLLDFGSSRFAVVGAHFAEKGERLGWGFTGIYGSAGAIEVIDTVGNTAFPGHVAISPPELADTLGLNRIPNLNPEVPHLNSEHRSVSESHLWVDIRHLVECIFDDTEPVPSGEHARHVIEIIEKGYEAAQSGQTQKLASRF